MKKLYLKHCHRVEIPETNSSSSHSLTIFKGDWENDLENYISYDGKKLTIPGGGYFGRSNEDFNDTISKLQYASFRILSWRKSKKDMFEKVVKNFLGIDEIVYNWNDSELIEEWEEQNPNLNVETDCPYYVEDREEENEVDHESVDLLDQEIFESEDTLRDFLFSDNSWIFCGEEDVTTPGEIFTQLDQHSKGLYLSLVPDNVVLFDDQGIGKVDFEILKDFLYSFDSKLGTGLYSGYRDSTSNPWVLLTDLGYNDLGIDTEHTLCILNNIWVEKKDNKFYLRLGEIPKEDNSNILVPFFNLETTKYPFTLEFYKKRAFKNFDMKILYDRDEDNTIERIKNNLGKPIFKINLIPTIENIDINEYI